MNTPRNDPGGRLPWPTWMTGPDHTAARALTEADTAVLNRAALHDALTHNHQTRDRNRDQQRTVTHPPASTDTPTALPRPDTGPWLALVILGLAIVTAMLTLTVTWT